MVPAGFYGDGETSAIPIDPTSLRDARGYTGGLGRAGRGVGAIGDSLPSVGYAVAAVAGAGLGGALIGWVASDTKHGAIHGAAFAAGLTGVADGFATFEQHKPLGTALLVTGLAGLWWSIMTRKKRAG